MTKFVTIFMVLSLAFATWAQQNLTEKALQLDPDNEQIRQLVQSARRLLEAERR